jgi:hypothetical protein
MPSNVFLTLEIFFVRFFPFLGADVLGAFDFADEILFESKVFDNIASNVPLFNLMKDLSFLFYKNGTLSVRTAS